MKIEAFDWWMIKDARILCNQCLIFDKVSEGTMHRCTLGDPNFDPKYVLSAIEDGRLIGFMLGVRRVKAPEEYVAEHRLKAWIKIFFTHPNYRRLGVATKLLNCLEGLLKDDGREELRVADFASWYFFPGVDVRYEDAIEFLLAKGFKKVGEAVDYLINLLAFNIPRRILRLEESLKREKVVFRKAELSEKGFIENWVKRNFGGFWAYEAGEGLKGGASKVWIAEEGGEVLGFSVYGALEPNWFGPIGVLEKARRRGIGSILLFKCLASIRGEGFGEAVIPWTSHLFFYTQIPGIFGVRNYWIMSKNLADPY